MRRGAALLAALLVLSVGRAAADVPAPGRVPHLRMREPARVCTVGPAPRCRDLPSGHYVDDPSWSTLDAEITRLQAAETRLGAENASLRASASGWQPGWRVLAIALATGLAGGAYAAHRWL